MTKLESIKRESMTAADCAMVMQQITLLSQLLLPIPLREFVEQLEYEDTLGPLLNPTAWIKNQKKADELRELAEAALTYQTTVKSILSPETVKQIMTAWDEKVKGNTPPTEPGGATA